MCYSIRGAWAPYSVVQGFKSWKQKQPVLLKAGLRMGTVPFPLYYIGQTSHKQPRFKKGSSMCVQRGKELLAVATFPDRSSQG